MPTPRLVLCSVWVAVLTSACDNARGNDALRRAVIFPDTARPLTPLRRMTRAYFGEIKRDSVIEAFVVRLSDDAREAAVYDPPSFAPLCRQPATDAAWLSWNASLSQPSRRFSVLLKATDQRLSGWVIVPPTALNPSRDSAELHLNRVNIDTAPDQPAGVQPGVYSSLRLHAETGDIGGTELILADSGGGLVGAVTFGEGSQSVPYALQHVRAEGDTLRFDILTEFSGREYVVVKERQDVELALRGSRRNKAKLLRKSSIGDFFAQPVRNAC